MRRLDLAQAVAIFGGRFDPPHTSHVLAVRELLEVVGFGEVWVIPTGHSAYKPPQASSHHRLELVRAAFGGISGVKVLDLEIQRPGHTYTADTLRVLPGPSDLRYFVIGTDQLAALPQWREFPALLGLCNWWVITRQGDHSPPKVPAGLVAKWSQEGCYQVGSLSAFPQKRMIIAPTDAPALSSTQIRRHIALQGSIPPNSLPTAVEEYLKRHRLYGS